MTSTDIKCKKCGAIHPATDAKCPSCGGSGERRLSARQTAKYLSPLLILIFVLCSLITLIIYGVYFKSKTIELRAVETSEVCGTIELPGWYNFDTDKADNGRLEAWPESSIFRPKKNYVLYANCIDFFTGQTNKIDDEFLRNLVMYNYQQAIETGRSVDIWEDDQIFQFNGLPAASVVLYYPSWDEYKDAYEYSIVVQLSDYKVVIFSAGIFPTDWPTERDAINTVFESFIPEK